MPIQHIVAPQYCLISHCRAPNKATVSLPRQWELTVKGIYRSTEKDPGMKTHQCCSVIKNAWRFFAVTTDGDSGGSFLGREWVMIGNKTKKTCLPPPNSLLYKE